MTPPSPVFVSRHTAAALCSVGVDTWDGWVRAGRVPGPAIREGQTIRWHWPSVEAALAGAATEAQPDPYLAGIGNNAKGRARATA